MIFTLKVFEVMSVLMQQ